MNVKYSSKIFSLGKINFRTRQGGKIFFSHCILAALCN